MIIIKYKYFFLTISLVLVLASIFLIATKGIKKGIDFTGGTIINLEYSPNLGQEKQSLDLDLIKNNLIKNNFSLKKISGRNTPSLQDTPLGEGNHKTVEIRLNGILDEAERKNLERAWNYPNYQVKQISENTIGPSIGKELTQKAILAVLLASIFIVLFITFAFREVSKPVASWQYGLITILTLLHDIIIPTGLYVLLGERYGAEADALFIVALLTIMGISIADTIVVFDRVRENLKNRKSHISFSEIVGQSLNQTFVRSLNTSLAVVVVLVALFYFGPIATHNLALILMTGIIVGTYSSIFVASPLLVLVEKWKNGK